jgi:hypothetical protein
MAAAKKKTTTMKADGKKPITFEKGGLHRSLGVPQDQPIPAKKVAAAARGDFGPKAQKQANFAQNVLKQGRKTAAKNRGKSK